MYTIQEKKSLEGKISSFLERACTNPFNDDPFNNENQEEREREIVFLFQRLAFRLFSPFEKQKGSREPFQQFCYEQFVSYKTWYGNDWKETIDFSEMGSFFFFLREYYPHYLDI